MFIFTVVVITGAIIFALALAASVSRGGGVDSHEAVLDDEHIRPLNMAPKPFATSHQGVPSENRPVVSAAGMQ